MKLHSLCEPSQNGLFFDWPQRHSAIAGLLAGMTNALPAASITVKGPSTSSGPLSRTLMVTCDMLKTPDNIAGHRIARRSRSRREASRARSRWQTTHLVLGTEYLVLSAPTIFSPALDR